MKKCEHFDITTYDHYHIPCCKCNGDLPDRWKDVREELIKAYGNYIKLLNDELNEIVGFAHAHGWRSTRYEDGKAMREYIELLLSKLPPPPSGKGVE